jgi:hypothetical protein
MKYLVFFLLLSTYCFGQKNKPNLPIDSLTNKITYKETVICDSIKAEQLYLNAKKWLAIAFKSAQNVIQLDHNNSLIAKGNINVYTINGFGNEQPAGIINFTFKIDVKDYKYRFEITDLYHSSGNGVDYSIGKCEDMIKTKDRTMGISHQKGYNIILNDMDSRVKSMITSLKSEMSKKVSADW